MWYRYRQFTTFVSECRVATFCDKFVCGDARRFLGSGHQTGPPTSTTGGPFVVVGVLVLDRIRLYTRTCSHVLVRDRIVRSRSLRLQALKVDRRVVLSWWSSCVFHEFHTHPRIRLVLNWDTLPCSRPSRRGNHIAGPIADRRKRPTRPTRRPPPTKQSSSRRFTVSSSAQFRRLIGA